MYDSPSQNLFNNPHHPPAVTYNPGSVGGVPAPLVTMKAQAAQYNDLYLEDNRRAFLTLPLTFTIAWMIAGLVPLLGMGYWMLSLALQGWKGTFFVLIFFFPLWIGLVYWVYFRLPIAAMSVHRDMGGPLSHHFERASELQNGFVEEEHRYHRYYG